MNEQHTSTSNSTGDDDSSRGSVLHLLPNAAIAGLDVTGSGKVGEAGRTDEVDSAGGKGRSAVEAVLRALAARLHASGAVTDGFEAAVLERERTYPTGLPTVIPAAIPHTDPEHVIEPGIAVATLREPVAFGEMGGSGEATVPVRLVVMLVLREAQAQLEALQRLIQALQDEAAVRTVLDATDDADLERRVRQWLQAPS
ncbi:PTS system galactitol-specific IIA component [Brachybacterium muris]|uniref:PTS sugar transporter subunit IIA n=1 Tax=Brachybacterium muris TaxID=219301 RepID=UPI00195A0F14|nr:PTS sugar transporter subunit IIA [Brachybacterium muris]MBM7502343.1 PTS system galactitol-specific IIA component [Brachybacterium muris]MCT1430716.1 PTS sugar transporter subunit IIA [Brachybacterium muris]